MRRAIFTSSLSRASNGWSLVFTSSEIGILCPEPCTFRLFGAATPSLADCDNVLYMFPWPCQITASYYSPSKSYYAAALPSLSFSSVGELNGGRESVGFSAVQSRNEILNFAATPRLLQGHHGFSLVSERPIRMGSSKAPTLHLTS